MVDLGIDVKHHTIIQKFRKGSKKSMLHQAYDHNDTSGRNLTNVSHTYYRSSELQNEVAKKRNSVTDFMHLLFRRSELVESRLNGNPHALFKLMAHSEPIVDGEITNLKSPDGVLTMSTSGIKLLPHSLEVPRSAVQEAEEHLGDPIPTFRPRSSYESQERLPCNVYNLLSGCDRVLLALNSYKLRSEGDDNMSKGSVLST